MAQTVSACLKPSPGVLGGLQPVPGSCGIRLPGMEARILREDGSDADVDEPGEIWLRGGNVALGYYNNEDETKGTFVSGWLRTGDKVRADADGTVLYVVSPRVPGLLTRSSFVFDLVSLSA